MKKQILKTVYTLLCCIFLFIPVIQSKEKPLELQINPYTCLLYTSDAADE